MPWQVQLGLAAPLKMVWYGMCAPLLCRAFCDWSLQLHCFGVHGPSVAFAPVQVEAECASYHLRSMSWVSLLEWGAV